ncbi:hypothetical protein ACFE04_020624 [Oxalis oulophora]
MTTTSDHHNHVFITIDDPSSSSDKILSHHQQEPMTISPSTLEIIPLSIRNKIENHHLTYSHAQTAGDHTSDHDDDNNNEDDDEDTGGQIAPIIKLEEVAVYTGEENEDALLDLARVVLQSAPDMLLKNKHSAKVHLVMRHSKTLKICANHIVSLTMNVQEHTGNEKSVLHATDVSQSQDSPPLTLVPI